MRDSYIREQLLHNPKANFKEIVEKAMPLQAAKVDNRIIGNSSSCSTADVHQSQPLRSSRAVSLNRNTNENQRSKSKTRLNYRDLGIEGVCLRCGRSNHFSADCTVNKNNLKCKSCGTTSHVNQVCIKSKIKNNQLNKYNNTTSSVETVSSCEGCYGVNKMIDI